MNSSSTEGSSGITKEFLQNALKEESIRKGTVVPEILSFSVREGSKPGDNYMSIIYSITLELNSPKTTRHLVLKCYPTNPARQDLNNRDNGFYKELQIYRTWLPELIRFQRQVPGLKEDSNIPLPYPSFVHGECIDFTSEAGQLRSSQEKPIHSLDNFIIMEDIRETDGFRMTNRQSPLDLDHMRLAIQALAKIHALSWAYRQLVEPNITTKFQFLSPSNGNNSPLVDAWNQFLMICFERTVSIYDKEFGEGNPYSKGVAYFKKNCLQLVSNYYVGQASGTSLENCLVSKQNSGLFGKDAENPVEWKVITHGDCFKNNILFKYDEKTKKPVAVTLVDLPLAKEGCVVDDLQYLIYPSTERSLRKAHLNDLLCLYYDTFRAICSRLDVEMLPGFSLETLKFRFHRTKLFGYYMANLILPVALRDEGNGINMEDMGEGKDVSQAIADIIGSDEGNNNALKERLVGVAMDMIEDGVL